MGVCHYCMNCGRCRGELPKPIYVRRCLSCSYMNELDQEVCKQCGASLRLDPGKSNTVQIPDTSS